MIAHDEPNRPFNLPPTIFTISDGSKQSSESKALPVAQLKVKIAPIILIPIPPVPERIYGGKIEECLHVTVAIGARVKVNVDVQEDGLELLGEDPRTFEEVHTNIVGRLQALLLKVWCPSQRSSSESLFIASEFCRAGPGFCHMQ